MPSKHFFQRFGLQNLIAYPSITQAMDSSNIRFMFSAVTDTIIQNALKDIGIL